jgi:autotransporter-associated beta strand protein
MMLCANRLHAVNYIFPGDATMSVGDGDYVTAGGLLTADFTGGAAYAGSLAASAVSGGDIHVVGAANVTTMTAGDITAGSLTAATVSGGTIHTTGDATIATLSVASVIAGGTVTVTTMTSGSIDAGTLYATTVTGGTIHTTGDAHITTLSGATMIVEGAASFTTISSGILTVNGPVTITTISSGSFTLNGNVVLTTFSAGALTLNGMTTSILTLSGGTIDLGSTNLTLSSGTFAGTFTGGTGTITKDGAGTLTFAQPNAFGGTLLITGGILAATVSGALGGVAAIGVQGASLLAVDYNPAASLTLDATATATISGSNLTLGAVINDDSATSNALDFTDATGGTTITLASLAGAGRTTFGSSATISSGGIAAGTVIVSGMLTSAISGGTVSAASLSATSVTGGVVSITGPATITTFNSSGGSTTVGGVAAFTTFTGGTANLNGASATITTLNGGTLNLGATTLTVSAGTSAGTITGASGNLIKDSGGTLTLTHANSFGGTLLVSGGTLATTVTGALGSVTAISVQGSALNALDYNPVATLSLDATATAIISGSNLILGAVINGNSLTAEALDFTGTTGTVTLLSLSGAGVSSFDNHATILGGIASGTVSVGGLLTSAVSGGTVSAGSLIGNLSGGDVTVSGLLTGNISPGAGTVSAGSMTGNVGSSVAVTGLLTGNISGGTNSFGAVSATTVSGGTNSVDGAATIGTFSGGSTTVGGVAAFTTFTGGTANLNGATATVTTLNGGTINLSATTLTVSAGTSAGTITGASGNLIKDSVGTLTLTHANSFGGTLLVSSGTLAATVTGALGSVTAISVQGAALNALDYNPVATLSLDATATAIISGSNLILGAVINGNSLTAEALDFTGTTGTVTLLSLSGAGVSSFDNHATILGGIASGTVSVGGLLTSAVSGGTVSAGSLTATSVTGGSTTVAGDASIGVMSAGTANLNGATATITTLNGGTINLGASTLTVSAGTSAGTITGASGNLIKSGPGLLTLSALGTFDYGGQTTILDGILRLGADQQLPATNSISVSGGVLDLGGFDQTLGIVSLTGGGIGNGRLNGLHFALEDGYVMAVMEGTGSVTKSSGGTVTLTAANTYGGGTTIDAGTLIVTHDNGLGTGPVVINGGTLVVDAVITNAVTIGTGGTLAGTGSMGQLTLGSGSTFSQGGSTGGLTTSGLKISGGAILIWKIQATQIGTAGYDSPVIQGGVDLSEASPVNRITVRIVSLALPGDLLPGNPLDFSSHVVNQFIFMTYGSPLNRGANANVTDLFSYDLTQFSYSDGSSSSAALWSMSFNDTSGQLTLTAVPEPSTYALSVGALGLAIAAVKRRWRKHPSAVRSVCLR